MRHEAFFRFLLPLAGAQEQLDAGNLRAQRQPPRVLRLRPVPGTESTRALDDRLLSELTYTVFDTETTGLNPSEGDEIIQIGATRIVNGKLRRQECFEQLVDPQRSIPAAGIPIHGIEPEMVQGQPTIDRVLPAFHAFAQDTVLVAHNAAFDMRFLQLKEAHTGVRFDQPVLDTLLLSAVVHPNQESHRLEAIAERFDVTVMGRHTALGDAMVTAEVFLKLIPLLQAQGIHTLGQAREAAQKTYLRAGAVLMPSCASTARKRGGACRRIAAFRVVSRGPRTAGKRIRPCLGHGPRRSPGTNSPPDCLCPGSLPARAINGPGSSFTSRIRFPTALG